MQSVALPRTTILEIPDKFSQVRRVYPGKERNGAAGHPLERSRAISWVFLMTSSWLAA
jgi:hypothetical protein